MVVVKLIIRILLLPVRISLTIVQLVVMFITWLSATVFHILSGIICITAILGYGFGQETGTEMIRMLAVGFLLYGERMEQVYQEKDGQQYDPFNEKLEMKLQKIFQKLSDKQRTILFDYMTETSNKCSDLNEFYYRMGLRDGLMLKEVIQVMLDALTV